MTDDEVEIDSGGRHASGRGFQNLADHYAQHNARFQSHLAGESPMPFEEVTGPYHELVAVSLDVGARLSEELRFAGEAQVVMSRNYVDTEQANMDGVASVSTVPGAGVG
ncbi:hypothetical protein AB0M44_10940 [Streptosporangium subroseum]|uniref:hypothetical protein n=1 Tax=Streptosporangium subroseum TaxID=106412 RepID=UPI00341E9087